VSAAPDTTVTFLRADGSSVAFGVKLEPLGRPDLAVLEDLLRDYVLDALVECVARVGLLEPLAVAQVTHAISHMRRGEWVQAWPPLALGTEGLFWAVAVRDGFLDDQGRRHPGGERTQCLIWLLALVAWVDGYAWRPRE
jgi:hypothetical protein